ncbi:16 kDa phloem protein 1 isoform X2 [Jatropha curcas]|uniref:16 kDa phloem protein 1 isoform X2 n=1 Tax=Jatropha curcas TaxID=180498 RepID=UPI0005FB2E7B|nr:16 kDa phloem protein 1 isoform X2 [Jatropha curcas]
MAIGILEVELVKAKGLKGTDFLGKIDPYVIVKYKGQERESSVASGAGGSPVWNEKLRFKVEYPGVGDDYKLILKIMDKDTFSRDDYLGKATVYVKDLLELGVENGTAEFVPQKYNVVQTNLSYSGEIQIGLTFTVKAEDDNGEEEYGGWKQSYF